MINSPIDWFMELFLLSYLITIPLLDYLCIRFHGIKVKNTVFSYAYVSELVLIVVGVGVSVLLKPVLAPLWLGVSALALAVLLLELWRLRV